MWKVDASENRFFEEEFKKVQRTYVADGHHRSAAAFNVGKIRKERALAEGRAITGEEDFNSFMSIIYPSDNLEIMDYNRVLKTLKSPSSEDFMNKLRANFADISECPDQTAVRPSGHGAVSLLIEGHWYDCRIKPEAVEKTVLDFGGNRAVSTLDVQVLNDRVLRDILGIENVRTSSDIDFVGGSRGLEGLVKRCSEDCLAAFCMHPVSIDQLLDVADAGQNMPPKSTWFEPKPRSGFVVRVFDKE